MGVKIPSDTGPQGWLMSHNELGFDQ